MGANFNELRVLIHRLLEFEWGPSSDMFLAFFNPIRSSSVDLSVYINTHSSIFFYYFLGLFTNGKTQWRFLIEYYHSWAKMRLTFKVSIDLAHMFCETTPRSPLDFSQSPKHTII